MTKGQKGKYVALSHCWGGSVDLMTTTSTLEDYLRGIPMQALPKNFHDAVIITRNLGFRLLWIDSLCIIQDSHTDWDRESAVMGDIYQNASLTIAAAGASKATDGILTIYDGDHGDLNPPIRLIAGSKSDQSDSVSLIRKRGSEEDLAGCVFNCPLSQRAWTLQERILSNRVLYYGRRQLYWQCQRARWSADDTTETTFCRDLFSKILSLSAGRSSVDNISKCEIYREWYLILSNYCQNDRQLTKESDKLPALGGIPLLITKLTDDVYVAGLWLNDIHRGMLWVTSSPPTRLRTHRAPSWSWARWDGNLEIDGTSRYRIPRKKDMEVRDLEIRLCGENKYGEVHSGWLLVEGLTRKIWRSKKQYVSSHSENWSSFLWILEENESAQESSDLYNFDIESSFWPTNSTDPQPPTMSIEEMDEFTLLFIAHFGSSPEDEPESYIYAHALILSRVEDEEDTFQRVGKTEMTLPDSPIMGEWKDWSRETIYLV